MSVLASRSGRMQVKRLGSSTPITIKDKPLRMRRKSAGRFVAKRLIINMFLVSTVVLIFATSYKLAYTHQAFNIQEVKINGLERLRENRTEALLRTKLQGNIFSVDMGEAMEVIKQNPWVESATYLRVLPSTVEVTVVERKPNLVIATGDKLFVADKDGVLLEEVGSANGFIKISGVVAGLLPGDALDNPALKDALTIKKIWSRDNVFLDHIAEVDISDINRIRAVTAKDEITIYFGSNRGKWEEKFLEYLAAREIMEMRSEYSRSMDLSFNNQVVVVRGSNQITDKAELY